jgi:hypothetical protein
VTEELGLEQFIGKRGAVQIAEPSLTARAEAMNRTRDEFLANAALAFNQHGKWC